MRVLTISFMVVCISACSSPRVAVVPPARIEELGRFPTLVTGVVRSGSIDANYTFRENYLQPAPSVTKRGWKGSLVVEITAVERGEFVDGSVSITRAFMANPYQLRDLAVRIALRPDSVVRLALDEDGSPRAIVLQSKEGNR